jgi:DNA modification methylase
MNDTKQNWKRKEIIGDCTLYLGDCLEVMPVLGKVDAVVTDPPYGINAGQGIGRSDRKRCKDNQKDWDNKPANVAMIQELNVPTIIWGGNYFDLPPSRGFLIWDKNNSGRDFADCEFAWTNQDANARMKTLRPMNMDGGKLHPTQKPIAIMKWCLEYLPYSEIILDPFMGSGTTGVACAKMGRKFIGIELDEGYFDIACKRIEEAYKQPDLFIVTQQPVMQQTTISF